jgi:hypothetical protein
LLFCCRNLLILLLLVSASLGAVAQQAVVSGMVSTSQRSALEMAVVAVKGSRAGTQTDQQGKFRLTLASGQEYVLVFRYLGYKDQEITLTLSPGENRILQVVLVPDPKALSTVQVQGRDERDTREQVSITRIDPRITKQLPSVFGDFNKVLSTLPGVTSNNELSSTYSVRGGNYDENLVYVNGIEIYRPFLVSNGQQEGLSFVNPDMVADVLFSTGGWQPKYGDKLSSVLDIRYKEPKTFAASATAGLMGGSVHVEAPSKDKRVTYLLGIRHKNGQYVLNSLQVNGDYRPVFSDIQAYVHADLSKSPSADPEAPARTSLGLLTSFARNEYRVLPRSQQTTFGTINRVVRLYVGFDGRERMDYETWQGGLNLTHYFLQNLKSELIISSMLTGEREFRDVEAGYFLCDVNLDPSSEQYKQCTQRRDVGTRFDHARNVLRARILAAENRNTLRLSSRSDVLWGFKISEESIVDRLSEWAFTDSADFVRPVGFLRTRINLPSIRLNAYAQHTYALDSLKTLTYGVRASYWTVNGQVTVSPRVQYSFITRHNPDLSFKTAIGVYHQPPFYRELRDQDGQLNRQLRAQRSIHFIAGSEYRFKAWERDFKLVSEAYYKHLTNVVPFDVDNLRLRYYAANIAKAYATGFDVRVNGEFIKGAESWFSLGLLSTREDIEGDLDLQGNPRGYIRRPTDQRLNLGIYFEDHIPNDPSLRMYLNLVYGSGLIFNAPNAPAFRGTFAGPAYKRVDIGFSKLITLRDVTEKESALESIWLSLEVLNLIDAYNTVSYTYVKDLDNVTYFVPNYLTTRLFNLRVIAKF